MFAYGADIGWLTQFEDMGCIWVDDNDMPKDTLDLLKDLGVNALRFRVFVDPPKDGIWRKKEGEIVYLGYADEHSVLKAAKKAAAKGFRIMVDFHYSDYFADPGCQIIPKAWESHSYEELLTDVYEHTFHVLQLLKENGIEPEWVQVGNEINNGIMLPAAPAKDAFSKLTGLLNRGYDAVKAVSPQSRVVTHLAEGQDIAFCQTFFNKFLNIHGGKTDILGLSFYPDTVVRYLGGDYDESVQNTVKNLQNLAAAYDKDIMVCEIGADENNEEKSYRLIKTMTDTLKNIPNGHGLGIFWWEPESNSAICPDRYALGAAKMTGEKTLQFTKALSAFIS